MYGIRAAMTAPYSPIEHHVPPGTAVAMLPFLEVTEVGFPQFEKKILKKTIRSEGGQSGYDPYASRRHLQPREPVAPSREERIGELAHAVMQDAGTQSDPASLLAFVEFVHADPQLRNPPQIVSNFLEWANAGQRYVSLYPEPGHDYCANPEVSANLRQGGAFRLVNALAAAQLLTPEELDGLKHFIQIAHRDPILALHCIRSGEVVSLGLRGSYRREHDKRMKAYRESQLAAG